MKLNLEVCKKCRYFVTGYKYLSCTNNELGAYPVIYEKNENTQEYDFFSGFKFVDKCPYILEHTVMEEPA